MTCRKCTTPMTLVTIEDCEDESGAIEYTYHCPHCGHTEGRIEY